MDTWACANEEEPPFNGLPPLPKAFRDPSLIPSSLPEKGEQEEVKRPEGSLDGISWLHHEMLKLRLTDWKLFNQLYTLALEIQDLKELQQETESFFKEVALMEELRHNGDINKALHLRSTGAFKMTI